MTAIGDLAVWPQLAVHDRWMNFASRPKPASRELEKETFNVKVQAAPLVARLQCKVGRHFRHCQRISCSARNKMESGTLSPISPVRFPSGRRLLVLHLPGGQAAVSQWHELQ